MKKNTKMDLKKSSLIQLFSQIPSRPVTALSTGFSSAVQLQRPMYHTMDSGVAPYFPNHYLHLQTPYFPRQGPSTIDPRQNFSTGPPLLTSNVPSDPRLGFLFNEPKSSTENLSFQEQVRKRLYKLRRWEYTTLGRLNEESSPKHGAKTIDGGTKFKVLSYNVLAPSLLQEHQHHLYKDVNPECLDWNSRYQLFLRELEDFGQPDILCFQEIEASIFEEFYEEPLTRNGYKGIFKKRTGDKLDGCAIFWKTAVFTMIGKLPVEFFQPHVPLLDRDNVALLVKLQSKIGKKPKFVVGTTHLLFNPKRNDVKLAQVQIILTELDRFAFSGFHATTGEPTYYPIILTGDFNTEPRSSIIRLITDGELQYCNENGQRPKLLVRKGMSDFIPDYVGVSDQCQHYRVVLERFNHWKRHRKHFFELDLKQQDQLINLYSSQILHQQNDGKLTATEETRIAHQEITTELNPDEHSTILKRINNSGAVCTFGAGELSHKFRMCDVYQPRLDRRMEDCTDGGIVTTKQNIWVCVDYIFYSKLWNEDLGRRVEGNLKLLRRLGLLNRNQCKEMGNLPSFGVSSDHYPLLAEFVIK